MLNTIERMTITLPTDLASTVKGAVKGGNYESSSEVIREALRDWKARRAAQKNASASLKADIDVGMADIAAGRLHDFDVDDIIKLGRKKLKASRSKSD